MMRRRIYHCEGIAMLELVTALVIVSLGLMGVVQMYQIGVSQIRESQRRTIALHALDNEIETLRALPREDLTRGNGVPWRSNQAALQSLHDAMATLSVAPYGDRSDVLRVTARLQWREGRRTVSREVVTLLGPRP